MPAFVASVNWPAADALFCVKKFPIAVSDTPHSIDICGIDMVYTLRERGVKNAMRLGFRGGAIKITE
jgi:hypothetical protein